MDILLGLVCGLALFLYGMGVMGDALKKSAGRKLKVILGKLTSNKLKGFLRMTLSFRRSFRAPRLPRLWSSAS